MTKMTKHPVRIMTDAFRHAFFSAGFRLYDNGEYPELESAAMHIPVFENPGAFKKAVLLQDGSYQLRTSILPYALAKMEKEKPVLAAAFGKVFDGADAQYPAHMMAEGAVISDMTFYDIRMLWKKIVRYAFGAAWDAELVRTDGEKPADDLASWGTSAMPSTLFRQESWAVTAKQPAGQEAILGYMGTMSWLGSALAGFAGDPAGCYAFSLDIDQAACLKFGLADRKMLFDNRDTFLSQFADGSVSGTDTFEDRCRDVLRTMGYSEGFGMKIYPNGIYKKMNMIQDAWDLNNQGVLLQEPLGEGTGLPTVLTPAIEQMLAEKYRAGESSARCFEISHIFIPGRSTPPIEKLALSFAVYEEGMDIRKFTAEADAFLTAVGNKNHFFIPTTQAIAYNIRECRLILDEKMSYLGGNLGGISEIAENNFGIGMHAFMANLELMPLENKAKEEYGYIAPELR